MKNRHSKERRIHPRLYQQLPIKVAANGYDFTTTTRDVSCVGTYCRVEKYIPPFTRVLIKLTLPNASSAGKKELTVDCKGVVVRSEDEATGGFNIAIFFNDINEREKKKISQYVNSFLPATSAAASSQDYN